MSWIKELVSQDLQRYQDEEFNLDLTYITPRLIAMGFPASGVEGMFRNHIDDISQYLLKKHPDSFLVFNLSKERDYDHELLDNRVINMRFLDHHAPPLTLLFRILLAIDYWLHQSPKNVAVIHCLAGRGRTGLVITSYLVFSGMMPSIEAALAYYAQKRSQTKKGVSQPSQRRYATYIDRILHFGAYPRPRRFRLVKIKFGPVPAISSQSGIKPMICIYNNTRGTEEAIFISDGTKAAPHYGPDVDMVSLRIPSRPILLGDIVFRMFHVKSFAKIAVDYLEVVRHMFHTGMEFHRANTMKLTKIRPANAPPAYVDPHLSHTYEPTCLDCVKYRTPSGQPILPSKTPRPENLNTPPPPSGFSPVVVDSSPSRQLISQKSTQPLPVPPFPPLNLSAELFRSGEKALQSESAEKADTGRDSNADELDLKSLKTALESITQTSQKGADLLETVKRISGDDTTIISADCLDRSDSSPRSILSSVKERAVLLNKNCENPKATKNNPLSESELILQDNVEPLQEETAKSSGELQEETAKPPSELQEETVKPSSELKEESTPEVVKPPSEVKPKVIPFSTAREQGKDYYYFTFTKSEIDLVYRDSRFSDGFTLQFVCVLEEESFVITAPECWDEGQYNSLLAVHQFNAQQSHQCKCSPNPQTPN